MWRAAPCTMLPSWQNSRTEHAIVAAGEFIGVSLCRFLALCWFLFPDEREVIAQKDVALMAEERAQREAERKRKLDALRQEYSGKNGSNRA